ncbi:MAG: glutamate formimidoyltransferase [Solirubrobacterales bacterium]
MLLGVPNFSEARDEDAIAAISAEFARGAAVVDRHTDPVHNRTVLTLSAAETPIAPALAAGAAACVERIDMRNHEGAHPCVGALDVCPVVFLDDDSREAATEQAQATAVAIADLDVPVFLYGDLASAAERRERAFYRRGGLAELTRRMSGGELAPDLGPGEPHPSAGAALVAARPPLVAFNLLLDTDDVDVAAAIAAELREAGGGPPGLRAIGIDLDGRAQVSINVGDPIAVPLAIAIASVRRLAAQHGARPVSGELVGLVPEAALAGLAEQDLPLPGFDPDVHVIERRLRVH